MVRGPVHFRQVDVGFQIKDDIVDACQSHFLSKEEKSWFRLLMTLCYNDD